MPAPLTPRNRDLKATFVEFLRRTSTDLPRDIESAIEHAQAREAPGSAAANALRVVRDNVALARRNSTPICQDTGTPVAWIRYPFGWSTRRLAADFRAALAEATARVFMRPNAVDSLTGTNSGDNSGAGFPHLMFEEVEGDELRVDLMLKGGGCENVGAQYSLPDATLGAARDLAGAKKCVLDALWKAQGQGCGPGLIGVGIGGDRVSGYEESKRQLFRRFDDENPVPELAAAERELFEQANTLGIGPMGFGGTTTVLTVKIGVLHRLPASYFVSVTYMCWANRIRTLTVRPDGSTEIT